MGMKIFARIVLLIGIIFLSDNCNKKNPQATSDNPESKALEQSWQHVADSSMEWSYGLMNFFNTSKEFNSNAEWEIDSIMKSNKNTSRQQKLISLQKENTDNMSRLWKLVKGWEEFRTEFDRNWIQYQNFQNAAGEQQANKGSKKNWQDCLDSLRNKMNNKFSIYDSLKNKAESDMKELDEFLRAGK